MNSVHRDDELAEKYYRQAIKLDVHDAGIVVDYAQFLEETGNLGKAQHYYGLAQRVGRGRGGR